MICPHCGMLTKPMGGCCEFCGGAMRRKTLRPHQAEIMQAAHWALCTAEDERYLLIYGGRGTMKTSTLIMQLAIELEILTTLYKGYALLVAAMTYAQLRDVFLSEWAKWVPANGPLPWTYNGTDSTIHLPNAGRILLRHAGTSSAARLTADKAARLLKGINAHGFYAPEALALDEAFYAATQLAVRAIPSEWRPGMWGYRLNWLDANPGGPDHWIHRRFLNPSAVEYLGDRAIVRGYPTTPATSLYTAARLALERASLAGAPHVAARDLDAEWVGAEGSLYHLYDGLQVNRDPLPPGGKWMVTFDFGFEKDPYVALLIYQHGGYVQVMAEVDRLRTFRDAPEGGMFALVKSLMEQEKVSIIDAVTGDLAGVRGGGIRELRWWADHLHCDVAMTTKRRYRGWLRLMKAFQTTRTGSDRPTLTIHPDCTRTLASLRSLTWNARSDDVNTVKGDDWADALRYFAMCSRSPLAE